MEWRPRPNIFNHPLSTTIIMTYQVGEKLGRLAHDTGLIPMPMTQSTSLFDALDEGGIPIGPSKFVIASNGEHDVLLWSVGRAAHHMIEEYGRGCEELMLTGFVDVEGVWILEGQWHTWRCYEGDYDMEFRGSTREPTPEEWQKIMLGQCPWEEEYDAKESGHPDV